MFDLDTCVSFITNQVSKKLADAFNERLAPLGVTRVQWVVLYYLGKYDAICQKELSEKMNIRPSTTAGLIDRLEKEGYVIREKSKVDRRTTILRLTERGKEMREKLLPEGEKMSKIYVNNISEEEIEIFKKVLKKMLDNIPQE